MVAVTGRTMLGQHELVGAAGTKVKSKCGIDWEESHSGPFYLYLSGLLFIIKLDGVGPVDNRPSMD